MRQISLKGFVYLVVFNILLSGTVTLAVLYFWDEARLGERLNPPTPVIVYVPVTGTPPTPDPALALNLPAETPVPTPSETPFDLSTIRLEAYRVQAGDTLGLIANRFDLSVADLLAVNDLEDPDRLLVGQEIWIPSGPLPTSTPFIPTATITPTSTATPLLSPTPSQTPTRTPNQDAPVLQIESVIGAGSIAAEIVKIVHASGREVSLSGWILEDEQGTPYTFPQLSMRQGSVVYLHTRNGINTVTDLYWGLSAAVWQSGETVTLKDETGQEIDRFEIP